VAWLLLSWGCAVYDQSLLGERHGVVSGGGAGLAAGGDGVGGAAGSMTFGGDENARTPSGSGAGGGIAPGGTGGGSDGAGAPPAGHGGDGGDIACLPETTAQLCSRIGKDCDDVDATDLCGNRVIAINCGTCQGFNRCAGGGVNNVCGALTGPDVGGITTASSVQTIGENAQMAFDLNANTKWFNGDGGGGSGWLAYQFPGTAAHVVHSYSVTSANDVPARDPTAWQLQGSNNNGAAWTTIDQQSAVVFADRHQTNSYPCTNSTAYRWYRLLVTANAGASSLQLAELVLYGD
jgi:hypothetical protein